MVICLPLKGLPIGPVGIEAADVFLPLLKGECRVGKVFAQLSLQTQRAKVGLVEDAQGQPACAAIERQRTLAAWRG